MRNLRNLALMGVVAAGPVWAGDVALLIGNENYANGRDIVNAGEMLDAAPELEAAGFEVLTVEDGDIAAMRRAVDQFNTLADGSGAIVIAVSGHLVSSQTLSWVLGIEADAPSLGTIDALALPVLMELAARAPGRAAIILGSEDRSFDLGAGLQRAIKVGAPPQGVTVLTGPSGSAADFVAEVLPQRGVSLATALANWPDMTGQGFLAPLVSFRPADGGTPAIVADPNAGDRAFWQASKSINTDAAYRGYLERFPRGVFADEARAEIARIAAEPALRAEADEKALRLSRDGRRDIQRNLSLLGFDPNGIDGLFGRGSRAAITKFQKANGFDETGFVTRPMLRLLNTQADTRAAELEEEARQRQAELERKDRAYWRSTGALGDEAGLRAYLERYPDGVFAEIALARLEPFEEARRAAAAGQDRADWDAAVSVGTLAAYRGYLQANPDGAFAEQAKAQIAELEFAEKNAGALQAAQRNEERLGLNQSTRRLMEDRMAKLGLKPGEIDGNFDENTRRAIRRYQEARNIQKTGYLNQATVVRLLADSVLR